MIEETYKQQNIGESADVEDEGDEEIIHWINHQRHS